ncbi:translation initiation factor IF-3, partial [Pediococcus acidilactici]|nr:translation initiation factor IF-3 [Pediococcus acidilactici]
MVNETIRAREVRLIGVNGDQLGVKSKAEAIQIAEEANLDVVV